MDTPVIEGFHLSPQQRHLWALQAEGMSYVAQCVVRLDGELNAQVLRDALGLVVERCEVLRTVFRRLPAVKVPLQVVAEGAEPAWRTLDLSEHGAENAEAVIEELMQQEARAPFDFERGPLVQSLLLSFGAQQHLLILTLPAMIADAGTLKNLFGELADCYAACLKGEPLGAEPLSYVQYAAWQQEVLEEQDAEEGRRHWRKQNLAALRAHALPRSEGAGEARFAAVPLRLSPAVAAQLEVAAARYGQTAATWLLACWQTLLWRVTRSEEVVVGDSYDGREFEALSGALGPLAKSLPVRVRLSPEIRFAEALMQAGRAVEESRAWHEYFVWPSEEAAADAPAEAYCPFGFEFTQWPAARNVGGVTFSAHALRADADRFDLKLSCARTDESLAVGLHYDASRSRPEDIIRLAGRLRSLLTGAIQNPSAALGDLDLLGEAERQQLLVEWNDTAAPFDADRCLHELFAEQAARTPDADAVVCGRDRLSYAQLNARADALAARLRARGVGPEVLVGLCAERGVEMIVGLLGVLKAGGAYLPLDPSYPPQRLRFMLEDARAPVLLTQRRLADALPGHRAETLFLDDEAATSDAATPATAATPSERAATPDNLAYVIYTSGSTGQPKGVMIRHASAVNLAAALRRTVYVQPPEAAPLRVGLNAPLAFDASVKQIVQLLEGHALYVIPDELRLDPAGLVAFAAEARLDALDCTPSQLKLLLEAGLCDGARSSPSLVLVGGEPLDAMTWASLSAHAATRFCNVYGPTECTVDATACDLRSSPSRPSIGRPLANVRAYVLDEAMRLLPAGLVGELYVGGAGLARGYHGRPDLTAERFVPDPFSAEPGARLYRTGDLARHLPDGQLEFVGRLDEQVKLHGYRIEPGEIEAALALHADVRRAAVVVREAQAGGPELVAYVVPRGAAETPAHELRQTLRESLPEYMIPRTFVTLDALPLTRHGKVDRAALPAPEAAARSRAAEYAAPRDEVERIIADIWCAALQAERVGRDDNFFDLGGHSLLMVKVHAELRAAFGQDLSIIELFKRPTVSSLAEYFSGRRGERTDLESVFSRAARRRQSAQRRTHPLRGEHGREE